MDIELHVSGSIKESNMQKRYIHVARSLYPKTEYGIGLGAGECTSLHIHRRHLGVTHEDAHLQELKVDIIQGWPHRNEDMDHSMRQYWPIRNKLAMVDGMVTNSKKIMISLKLHRQILQQLCSIHMGIEKIMLLTCESVYLLNMNTDYSNLIFSFTEHAG